MTSEKWTETMQTMKNEDFSFENITYIVSFVLEMPSTNASLESVFANEHVWLMNGTGCLLRQYRQYY